MTKWKDQLPGGLGDEKTPEDFDPEAIKKGIKVEREHVGDDTKLATEIVLDHLTEDPQYYDKLAKMETGNAGADDVEKRIIEFLAENPKPDDSQVHELAEQIGMSPDDLEERIYELLSEALKRLKSQVDRKSNRPRTFIEGEDFRAMLSDVAGELYGRGALALAEEVVKFVGAVR